MLIVDGHEDLAYNALADGRNYLRSAWETRAAEAGALAPGPNGTCMLGLPEWLEAGVAVIIATITAIPASDALPGEPGSAHRRRHSRSPKRSWRSMRDGVTPRITSRSSARGPISMTFSAAGAPIGSVSRIGEKSVWCC